MKKLIFALWACAPIFAQPTAITITGPVYLPFTADLANGSVTISRSYTAGDVIKSDRYYKITAGAFPGDGTFTLAPGTYTATYALSRPGTTGTTPSTAYWTVPASGGPYAVSAIQGTTTTTPATSVAITQLTQGGATNGQCLAWSTSSLSWIPATCGAGGGGAWGSITGTLSDQTDLVTALGLRLAAASNLSDLASASTARTNLGLGTAATHSTGDYDASGAASTAQAAAISSSAASLAAWTGSANITTLGTITAGIWHGTVIGLAYLPTIPTTQISGLAAVATSGVYSDLTGKPTIPTVASTSAVLKGNGSGGAIAATSGTDYVVPAGNVATATALAANGTNCSAGNYPLGVDASGNSESCTAATSAALATGSYYPPFGGTMTGNSSTGGFTALAVACWEFPVSVTFTPARVLFAQYGAWTTSLHAAWGFYSTGGTLLFQTGIYTGSATSNGTGSVTFVSPTALQAGGQYSLCYTDDSASALIIGNGTNYFNSLGTGYGINGGAAPMFTYTTTSAATVTTLAFPGTLTGKAANLAYGTPHVILIAQ